MALASAKQLLDELMGRNRDLAPAEKGYNWDDADVCKHFLVKFCPNDLFINTKADLGPCSKIHDENMRREYAESTHYMKSHYEDEFLRFCQGMLADVEKRIRRAKMRLQLGQKEAAMSTAAMAKENEEKCQELTAKINALLIQVEQLGCEGKVEEAQAVMRYCDQLKEERYALQRSESSNWLQTAEIAAAQEKQMEVCGVCGAFLIVGDAQQRVDDHLMGKQHVGYARLKSAVDEIVHKREKEREQREKEREERRRRLEREEERRRESYRSEDHKKRDVRRSHRSRSRSRSKDRRSRSYTRRHRSRSGDRSCNRRHSSHRERTRDRSKYRSRSRSPDSKHSCGHFHNRNDRKRSRSKSSDHSGSDKRSSRDYDKKKPDDSPENEENSPKITDVDYRMKPEKNSKDITEENDAENSPKSIHTDYRIKPSETSKHETEGESD